MASANVAVRINLVISCPRIQILVASDVAIAVRQGSIDDPIIPGGSGFRRCYGGGTVTKLARTGVGATVGRVTGYLSDACVANSRGGVNVSKWRTVLGAGLVWLLAAGAGSAQEVAGSQVSGMVRDTSGGVLPGVEVTLTKTDTGTSRTVFTGADGTYVFPNLPVGPYRLTRVPAGFHDLRAGRASSCRSTRTRRSTSTLAVGNIGEEVTVTAARVHGRNTVDRASVRSSTTRW